MKIKKITTEFRKEFDRVKFSLCGQYWNKYASFVNIENTLLFIYENMQDNVLNIMELCRMWNMIIEGCYISFYYFYYVHGKEIIKQKIPCHQ